MSTMNQNPFAAADSDESDQIESDEDGGDVSDILRNSRPCLGLDKNYVPYWRPPHAIREYHQNWKDSIKETNRLAHREFKILNKGFNSKDVYTIEARHPDTDTLLGFISWDKGTIQYSNFGAQLARRCLNMGTTTKRDDDDLAGTHGEGFKVASLVMVRRGYHVRYEASSFYWNFAFGRNDKDVLYCKLSAVKEKKLKKLMDVFAAKAKRGIRRELKGNIWEDVTVRIGVVHGQGKRVEKADFLRWIKVSLDLDSPSNVITTPYGSLILDERFKGRIYLKGLYLEAEPAMPFKFCYNFYRGEVNRDRERFSNTKEEAKTLAKIWAEAVKLDEASSLPHLVEMLQADKKWADVNLAQDYMSEETAKAIWKRLRDENIEGKRFYYYAQDGDKEIELIVKSLQKEPAPLKEATWLSLRKFQLIRTPEQQRHYLLQNAPITSVTKTSYSEDVVRALRSVLALDSRTQKLRLEFRSRDKAELDLLLEGSNLVINDKWLDFDSSHKDSSCSAFLEAKAAKIDIARFSCSHIVKNLYDLILVELSKGTDAHHNKSPHSEDYLRQMVSERIDQMPCMVHVDKGDVGGVLIVRWVHAESERLSKIHSLELMGRVTMHRESTCAVKKLELLTSSSIDRKPTSQEDRGSDEDLPRQRRGECGCPEQLVMLKDGEATFHSLDYEDEYFPMVARTDSQAFFAQPPKPLHPDAPVIDLPDRSSRTRTPMSSVPAVKADQSADLSAPIQDWAFDDLYDVSDDDDGMVIDTPSESLPGSSQILSESGPATERRYEGSRLEHRNSPPKSTVNVGMRGDDSTQNHQSLNNDLEKLTAELEKQKSVIRAKDQRLRELETEIARLNSQITVEKPKTIQLEEEVNTQQELLAAKEKELVEMKMNLAAQSNDLEVKIAALEADEHHRDQCTAEIERLHALVGMLEEGLHANEQGFANSTLELNRLQAVIEAKDEELRRKDVELEATQVSQSLPQSSASTGAGGDRAMEAQIERLQQQNRDLKKQRKELQSDLEQAQEEVRKALEIAASAASRSAKRSRVKDEIKDEIKDEDDDSLRFSDGALKRSRQDNIVGANTNSLGVIELD